MGKETSSQPGAAHVFSYGRHRPRIHPSAFVATGAYIVGKVTIKRAASVWFGAVLRGDFGRIEIGESSLIEDNVVVHSDVVVGKRCVIGHGAILHGCSVEDGAVVGANAVVFDRAVVGKGALVTAGSVVYPGTRVPDRSVFGNAPGANNPRIAAVGDRTKRWRAADYVPVIEVYQRTFGPTRRRAKRRAKKSRGGTS